MLSIYSDGGRSLLLSYGGARRLMGKQDRSGAKNGQDLPKTVDVTSLDNTYRLRNCSQEQRALSLTFTLGRVRLRPEITA